MHDKVFSEGDKFLAANFFFPAKMSCGKNSSDVISSGQIWRDGQLRNLTRKKFHAKFPVAKINAAKNPVFIDKILQEHWKWETAHQLGSYILCLNKMEKLPKNHLFGKKLEDIHFSQNSIVYELAEVSLVSVD